MNEELLQKLYDKYGFSAKGPFEQFRSDMNDPSVRRRVYDKYLSQKGSFDQFESDLGVGQSVQEDVQPEPEKEDKGVFYNTLGKIPLVGGALQSAYDAAERGLQKGATVEEGINAMFGGLSEDEATSVAAILKQNLKQVKGDNSITKKFTDEEGWNLGSMAGAWAEGMVESMAMMGRGLWDAFTDAKTAAVVGSATAAGAAAGAPIAGVGALVGATSAALGTSSGLLEASQILYQEVQKELNERGLPITKQNIKNIFSDEDWLEATRKKAAIKGGVVGAFDLLSGVVGGKFGVNVADLIKKKGLAKATMGDYLKAVGKASVIDPFFGAAGEYVSGQAIGEPASAKELFLEANPFGPGSITAPLSLYKDISKIRDAKDSRTQADKNNTPITKAEDSATKSSLNVGSLIDAVTSNDEDLQQKTFADLAARHTQQEFDEMIRSQGKIEGLDDNLLQALSEEFSAYKAKEVKFENNGLTTDQKSRATELRAEVEKLEKQLESIGVLKNESDESLKARHEQTEEMIKAKIEEMKAAIAAVANRAETPIEDSPEWYKNKYEELSTVYSGEETSLAEKEKELLSIGRQLSQDIEEGSAEKIDLYQSGRGYFGSMDEVLFEDDGDSNPVLARKNLRGVMNALQKSIPATVHARIGKGDITAGRNLIKRAKELSLEIEGLHAKLNPGERLRRKNELNEIKSRYEALTETVPNEEYQLFINKGVVTPERLNSIAEKVKENPDKPKLSKNEKAIFDAKVSEINDILREKFSVDQKTKSDAVQEQKTDEVLLRNKQVGLQEMGEGNALAEEVQKTPDQKEEVVSNTASVATKGYNPSIQLKVHKETGGSTFTLDGENKAGTKSASVSIFPERSKIFDGEITEQDIADFKETNSDLYSGNEDVLALGTWFNKETGKTTLDVSSVLPKKEAVALGKEYNQISVFDLETFEEIPTGGTGEVISGLKSEIDRVSDIRKIQKESSKTSKPETTTKEEPVKSKAKPEPVVEKKPEILQVKVGDVLIKYDKDGNKSEEIRVTKVYQKDKNGYWTDQNGERPNVKTTSVLNKKSTQDASNAFVYYKSLTTGSGAEVGPTSPNMFNTDKSAGKVFYRKEGDILFQEDEPLEPHQSERVEDVSKVTKINPKNILDLIRVGRKLFNLPFQQALANAVVTDKLYGRMAKLENVTKSDIYKSIEYRKSTIEELTGKELQEVDKIRRGAMQSLEDGRAIIYALTDPNVSTPMHELAHVFEHYLTDEEKTTILKEAGHDSWTRETSEFFARGFEKYLAEGVSPTPKLQKYFEMFKKWLTEIYKGIKNSAIDIPLSVEMDNIYANMLDDEDFIVPPKSGIELNKATMNYIRDKVIDVDPLSPDHVSVDDQIKDAMENHITPENDDHPHHKEITLAYQAIIGKLLNASEQIAVGYAIRKLSDLRSQKEQELKLLKKGLLSQFKSDVTDIERHIAIIEGDIEILTRGLIRAGTTAGRALAIRKELLEFSKDNYEVMRARLIDHMPKDYKINKADETYLKELSERIKKLKEEIEASDVTHKKNSQAKQETIADISAKRLSQKGKERKEGRRSRSLKEATANLDKLLKGNNC